jgi:adenylate kinase
MCAPPVAGCGEEQPVLDIGPRHPNAPVGRNLMLLGPPGAGKGTYSKHIAERLGLPIVGTGDMIRDVIRQGGERAERLRAYSDAGALVPDQEVLSLLNERLGGVSGGGNHSRAALDGFILDGFPRTVAQARALETGGVPLHLVINIVVPDQHVVSKLMGRRGCTACGNSYNVADVHDDEAGVYMPPILPAGVSSTRAAGDVELLCECGSTLSARSDDTPQIIAARLALYHQETSPLIEHYSTQGILAHYRVRYGVGDMTQLLVDIAGLVGPTARI